MAVILQAFAYAVRSADTGVYNCRKTASGSQSPHSWATALDLNWLTNPATGGPYGGANRIITDMPAAMVTAIKNIRTKNGVRVFGWGGDYRSFKDAMHYEIIATPAELAAGIDWTTVSAKKPDPHDPKTWPVLELGDTGPTVRELQVRLIDLGFHMGDAGADSIFGPIVDAAIRQFQRSRGLTVDGIVGLQTWTAILKKMPALDPGDAGPVKDQPPAPDYAVAVRWARGYPADERAARALGAALYAHTAPIDDEATVGTVHLVGAAAARDFDRSQADTVHAYAGAGRTQTWQLVSDRIADHLTSL